MRGSQSSTLRVSGALNRNDWEAPKEFGASQSLYNVEALPKPRSFETVAYTVLIGAKWSLSRHFWSGY